MSQLPADPEKCPACGRRLSPAWNKCEHCKKPFPEWLVVARQRAAAAPKPGRDRVSTDGEDLVFRFWTAEVRLEPGRISGWVDDSTTQIDIPISSITEVKVDRPMTWIGTGRIDITHGGKLLIINTSHGDSEAALQFADEVMRRKRRPAPDLSTGERPEVSVIDALERLARLREQGHLDDQEFEAAKARILGGG